MMIKLIRIKAFITISLLITSLSLTAQGRSEILQKTKPLFLSHEPLKLVIEADFKTIKDDRDQDRSYHPAKLYQIRKNDTLKLDIELKTRGNFRLKCENCDFPPLKFKFNRESVKNTVFEGQRKLKMVTHCRDNSDKLQACTMKEYLSYRTYNIITDISLNVRLVEITYVDVNDKDSSLRKMAFFIEDEDDMADRNGMSELKVANIHQKHTDYYKMAELSLFQYMIGNTDWSVPKLHNIILLKEETHSPPIAVPYDFDWSGLVNAPYAEPAPQIDALNVQQRVYRGYKRPIEDLEKTISKFLNAKTEIMDLFLDFSYLEVKEKQRCVKYIDDFFETLENKSSVRRDFIYGARSK